MPKVGDLVLFPAGSIFDAYAVRDYGLWRVTHRKRERNPDTGTTEPLLTLRHLGGWTMYKGQRRGHRFWSDVRLICDHNRDKAIEIFVENEMEALALMMEKPCQTDDSEN